MDFNRYDKKKLLLLLVFSLLVVQTVAAQNIADTFSNIPAFQGLTIEKVVQLYDSFWWLWDFIVYALILSTALKIGASNAGTFGQSAGKIGGIFAVVLSIGAVFAEKQIGFNLKEFSPLALAIGLFAFGLYLWRTVKGLGLGERGRLILGILYVTIYMLISPRLQGVRETIKSLGWIISIMDILFFVFIIFIIIDLISFVRGLRGGGGGGGGGLFGGGGGRGSRPGDAAVATAEDEAALAEEGRERGERAAEVAEEARELNDIRAIRGITVNENRLYDGIKNAINKMINALRKMVKAGRMSPDLVEEVRMKVSEIVGYSNRIKQLETDLRARITDLERLEVSEATLDKNIYAGTRKQISEEIVARKAAGWAGKAPSNAAWVKIKEKFEKDAVNRVNQQIATVKSTLEAHAVAVGKFEIAFANYFTQAEAFLRANDIPRAILQFEAARADIDKIQAGLRALEGSDVNKVQGLIQRRLADVRAETKTGTLNSIGIKRQVAGIKQAQTAGRRLRGAGGFLIKGIGKITRIRRGP